MNQNERKTVMRRMVLLIAVAALVMGLYALRLIFLQLVNSDEYKSQATNTTDYNFTVTAARGDIVDSTGKRIATTTTSYNVVLNKLQMGDEDLDSLLQRLVELFEKNGESWTDTLLISQPDAAGNYTFTARDDSSSDQRQLTTMKENLGLQQYATANDVMEMLVEKNNLQDLPLRWQRTLAGIHYEMELQAFSNVNNFVMAENVFGIVSAAYGLYAVTNQHPQLRAGRYRPGGAGPCGQDHRRKVEGDRRERPGDLPPAGQGLQHERCDGHLGPGIGL